MYHHLKIRELISSVVSLEKVCFRINVDMCNSVLIVGSIGTSEGALPHRNAMAMLNLHHTKGNNQRC